MHDLDGKIYQVGSVLNMMYGEGKEYTVDRSLVILKTLNLGEIYNEWIREAFTESKPETYKFNNNATIQFSDWLIKNKYCAEVCSYQIVYSCNHGVAYLSELSD